MPKTVRRSHGPAPAPLHRLKALPRRAPAKAACGHACSSCVPMGETQIIALLLVAVFGLASVLTIAVVSLNQQQERSAVVAPIVLE